MIVIYLEKDIQRAIERYIHLRETVGLSRDDAKQGAILETEQAVQTKQALAEDGILPTDEQTRLIDASKKVTDKLPTKAGDK